DALASFRKLERSIAIAVSVTLLLTCVTVLVQKTFRREWHAGDWWLAAVLGAVAIYLAAPNSAAGGGQITFRLSLFPFLLLILWLAAQNVHAAVRASSSIVILCASIALLWLHIGDYRRLNERLTDYIAIAPQVPAGSRVLAIDFSRDERTNKTMLP